jgi:hypothetical protein
MIALSRSAKASVVPRSRPLVFVSLTLACGYALVAGCGGSTPAGTGGAGTGSSTSSTGGGTTTASGDTTTASSGSGGSGGQTTHPLEEGAYVGTLKATTNDTCNGAFKLFTDNMTLAWKSGTELTLTSAPDLVIDCTLAQGGISCAPYAAPDIQVDATTLLHLGSTPGAFTVLSPSSFDLVEAVTFSCIGAGCAAFAAANNVDLPCSITANENFTIPPCDILAGGCDDSTAKCTLAVDPMFVGTLSCEAPPGAGKLADPCTRPTNTLGVDTCGPGLFCSGLGYPKATPQQRECRQFCELGTACPAGTGCTALDVPGIHGFCAPTCTSFQGDCGADQACRAGARLDGDSSMGGNFYCNFLGTLPPYAPCTSSNDCQDDTECRLQKDSTLACQPLCDATTHPCADPLATCQMFSDVPGLGRCVK